MMIRRLICVAALVVVACRTETPRRSFQLATTTSVDNSGLLRVLAARFEQRSGIAVHPFVVGSGKALRMAEAGEVELTITHDPEAERAFVAAWRPALYRQFMWNDFVIAGPSGDPAGVRQASSAVDAFARIHRARAKFASRNDRSGTHTAELRLWRDAGANPTVNPHYMPLGQSMASLLRTASELQAYALTDRATYDALAPSLELGVLFEGDPRLRNVYAVTLMRRGGDGQRFAEWLLSPDGRQAVEQFTIAGKRQFRWIDGVPPPPQPMRVGGKVKPPTAIHRVDPDLASCGKTIHISGMPIIEAVVEADGTVSEVRSLKTTNPCVDRAFVQAVKQWRFKPATLDDRPVRASFNLTLHVHLR